MRSSPCSLLTLTTSPSSSSIITILHYHHPLSSFIFIIHLYHPPSLSIIIVTCVGSRFVSPSGKISWAVFLITNRTSLITDRYQLNSPLYLSSRRYKIPQFHLQRSSILVQEKNQTQVPHRSKDTYLAFLYLSPRPPKVNIWPHQRLLSQLTVDKENQRD